MVVNAPSVQHRQRRRARGRAAARARPERAAGHGLAARRPVEAVRVHRRRAAGQGRRHPRPRPIGVLVAQRLAAFGMTVIAYDPYVPAAARRPSSGVRMVSLDELLAEADFISVHLPQERRDHRAHRRPAAAPGQARGPDHQRGPRRHRGRGRAGRRARGTAGWPGRARRVRQRAVHRQPAVRLRQRRGRPRTWARAPTRRRRRRAPRWPGRSGWRWRASSCRTR